MAEIGGFRPRFSRAADIPKRLWTWAPDFDKVSSFKKGTASGRSRPLFAFQTKTARENLSVSPRRLFEHSPRTGRSQPSSSSKSSSSPSGMSGESTSIGTPGVDLETRMHKADFTWATAGAAVSLVVRNC